MKKQINSLPPVVLTDIIEIVDKIKNDLQILEGKTILIAGAAGFLPSYMVHTLAYANTNLFKKPAKIICLDNFRTGKRQKLKVWEKRKDIKLINADITKKVLIQESVDYIIHGASIASPVWYRKFPLETVDVNVGGTRNLLDLAKEKKIKGFLYLSSSEIYGDPFAKFIPTNEDYWGNVSPTGPRACYDESKRLAETLCMIYWRNFSVPIKIIRPFNTYGPGLRLDDGRVVPDFISNALSKKPITILSDGRATRSFCYISDAIVAMFLILLNKVRGEAYNVGNDEEVSIKNLAKTINNVAGNKAGVQFNKSPDKAYLTDNPQRRVPNLTKTKQLTKWTPQVSLKEGVRRTLRYYREGGLI